MQYLNLRTIFALLLSFGLGATVLAQSHDAAAEGDYAKKSAKKSDASSTSASADMESTEQKTKYFDSWAQSEKPGQSYAHYASSGLILLDGALSSVIKDVRAQPVGGGPSEGDTEKKNMAKDALGEVDQHQKKLTQIADDLRDYSKLSQNPTQFHEAASATSQIFSSLQQTHFPSLEGDVKKVQESVDKLDVSKPLAAQSKHVESFFNDSSKVLDKMSEELKQDAVGGGPSSDQESNADESKSDEASSDEASPDKK